jgi:hypothetical protein
VQNKANLAGRAGPRRVKYAKRSQSRRVGRSEPAVGRTNKPNFRHGRVGRGLRPFLGRLCETNPIWGSGRGWGPIVRNKANSAANGCRKRGYGELVSQTASQKRTRFAAVKCAKRSQFPPGRAHAGVNRAKRSQAWAGWGIWGTWAASFVQTNPICRPQAPDRWGGAWYAPYTRGRMRQTKPIRWRGLPSPPFQRSTIPRFQSDGGCTNKPNRLGAEIPYYCAGLWWGETSRGSPLWLPQGGQARGGTPATSQHAGVRLTCASA